MINCYNYNNETIYFREVCISLAKYEDGVARPEQTEAILGEPDCAQITLTLPTEACRKEQGYHH